MTNEPMKCANCGEPIVQLISGYWTHWLTGFQECRLYAKPMEGITGIKSEDIKPVEGVTAAEVGDFLNDLHERPPLPTSRKWVAEDGENFNWLDGECEAKTRLPYNCNVLGTHHRHVAATSGGVVCGRWYTDGPFTEAK